MSMLGGGNVGRNPNKKQGFQGAVAGASNVRAKPQVGSGLININKLKNIQSRKKTGFESYKLNPNGVSRFRLVMPIGKDDLPMVSADLHWIPAVTDEGKEYKRPVFCYEQFGFSKCPMCALRELLANANDQELVADADTLRVTGRWAAYVLDRDYLAGSEDPMGDFDPQHDKVVLFDKMPPKVADEIISYLGMRTWGNASSPVFGEGYDIEVEGEQKGKMYNGYKVSDFTVRPVPRDFSPEYNTALLKNVKPLSEAVTYLKAADFQKLFDPILLSLAQSGEEGAQIVEGFQDDYHAMLEEIKTGPAVQDEVIEVQGDDDDEAQGGALPEAGGDTVQEDKGSEPEPEASVEVGGPGESDEEVQGDSEEGAPGLDDEGDDVPPSAPVQKPKPVAAAPSGGAAAGSSLLGRLKSVGKK